MKSYFFKRALLNDGWQENIRVELDTKGFILRVISHCSALKQDKILDCVIPMLPNCHSHVFQRTMAGLTEYKTSKNDSFWSWRKLMYQYANQIDASQLYHIARYCYQEMLHAGYCSVCEFHYLHRDLKEPENSLAMSQAIINAAHDTGIGLTLLPVLYTQAHIDGTELSPLQQRFKLSVDEYINLYRLLESQLHNDQNIGLCFHSLRAVSLEQMHEVLSELYCGQPVHIHISEQMSEVQQILTATGRRPVELLYDHFDVNTNWCLIHATHLLNHEIKLIAQSKSVAGICPLTEANLGDGIFPLDKFIENKGRFAIGSDSHILINPMQELQLLEYSQRLHLQQRVVASTQQNHHVGTYLWNQSITSGAQACQLPVKGIASGQEANWINLDTRHPALTGLNGQLCLDSAIFANNTLSHEIYTKGVPQASIAQDCIDNYKKTLISLR